MARRKYSNFEDCSSDEESSEEEDDGVDGGNGGNGGKPKAGDCEGAGGGASESAVAPSSASANTANGIAILEKPSEGGGKPSQSGPGGSVVASQSPIPVPGENKTGSENKTSSSSEPSCAGAANTDATINSANPGSSGSGPSGPSSSAGENKPLASSGTPRKEKRIQIDSVENQKNLNPTHSPTSGKEKMSGKAGKANSPKIGAVGKSQKNSPVKNALAVSAPSPVKNALSLSSLGNNSAHSDSVNSCNSRTSSVTTILDEENVKRGQRARELARELDGLAEELDDGRMPNSSSEGEGESEGEDFSGEEVSDSPSDSRERPRDFVRQNNLRGRNGTSNRSRGARSGRHGQIRQQNSAGGNKSSSRKTGHHRASTGGFTGRHGERKAVHKSPRNPFAFQ